MLRTAAVFALGIALLALIINLQFESAVKFALGIAAMFGMSKLLGPQLRIKDDYGMLMVRSKAGIRLIENLAKSEEIWKIFADVGTIIAYGAAGFFMLKRPLKERTLLTFCGLMLLSILAFFVAPYAFPFLLEALGGNIGANAKAVAGNYAYAVLGLMYIGGFALMAFASLLGYTAVIVSAVIGTFFFGTEELAKTAPGATFIIPGINIPFAEGIAALAIILLVHEFAHAVLSKIAKVRILSSGIVLFGVIPVGAFVEPDENMLSKVQKEKQMRVLVAGSSANFMASLAIFLLFLGFIVISAPYKESGLLVVGGNLSGSVIYTINGENASLFLKNADNETLNSTLMISASTGNYRLNLAKTGLAYYDLSSAFFLAEYSNPVLNFVYNLLGLAFSLNFVIGLVNLLPLPFFDGYRLLEINVDNKMIVNGLAIVAALGFLINFLPWVL